MIIHVNPLQEWLQPEGDLIKVAPMETISRVIEALDIKIIVKEVGQGMGKESLKALLKLPIQAIEFAAHGGTNFAKLEMLRNENPCSAMFEKIAYVGHSAEDMVQMVNELKLEIPNDIKCHEIIISGGVKDFLDGYYLTEKCSLKAIYGQASGFLKHAQDDYEQLSKYVNAQIEGLKISNAFLKLKSEA